MKETHLAHSLCRLIGERNEAFESGDWNTLAPGSDNVILRVVTPTRPDTPRTEFYRLAYVCEIIVDEQQFLAPFTSLRKKFSKNFSFRREATEDICPRHVDALIAEDIDNGTRILPRYNLDIAT